jgi:CheY-like chemotaxis protein
VNVNAIAEEVVALLRATLPAHITIRTEFALDVPNVSADPGQLHQVLLNLATNAAHAIGAGTGIVTIAAESVDPTAESRQRLHLAEATRYVKLSVQDSGIGMSAAVLDRIFEPFFTTKPRGQGTGLGLAVVHGIVRAHDGTIDVSSTPGKGSTFDVYLPAANGDALVAAAPDRQVQRGAGQQILYVDDEESLVYLITRVLERLGYRVTGLTDAESALAAIRAAPDAFDALVTDLSMPGLSGIELSKRVLAICPQFPVVMTSGYVRQEDRALALKLGVRELVMKPNTVDALGDVLHRLLQSAQDAAASASKIT